MSLGRLALQGCLVVGLLVVFVPFVFYLSSSDSLSEMEFQATDQYGTSITQFHENIEDVQAKIAHNEGALKEIKRNTPWYGEPDTRTRGLMQRHQGALDEQYMELESLVQTQQAMLVQYRAHAPVWSRLAFEEARELYLTRQKAHAGMSARAWTWGMMFEGIFGYGRRSEDLMGQVVMAVVKLAWNLSFGAIISLVDFCIRLPFYLKEYDLYSSDELLLDDGGGAYRDDTGSAGRAGEQEAVHASGEEWSDLESEEEADTLTHTEYRNSKEKQRVMRHSSSKDNQLSNFQPGALTGRSGLPSTTLVYLVMCCGAVVGTVFILLLIWSPCIACGVLKYRQMKNDPNYAARVRQQMGRRQHYD
jgi:hypothetical protein